MIAGRQETIRRLGVLLGWGVTTLVALAAAVAWVLLGLQPKPLLVNKAGFSQAVYDRDGHLLRLRRFADWASYSAGA